VLGRLDGPDLTCRFSKVNYDVGSGEGIPLLTVLSNLNYRPVGDEADISHLLIVDDVFKGGKTAAAMILKLQVAGLPAECRVTVACPLWVCVDFEL
jgi:hypothetical protein